MSPESNPGVGNLIDCPPPPLLCLLTNHEAREDNEAQGGVLSALREAGACRALKFQLPGLHQPGVVGPTLAILVDHRLRHRARAGRACKVCATVRTLQVPLQTTCPL